MSEIDVPGLIDKYVVRDRARFYRRAVAVGIIDPDQAVELLCMFRREYGAQRAEDDAWEAAHADEVEAARRAMEDDDGR